MYAFQLVEFTTNEIDVTVCAFKIDNREKVGREAILCMWVVRLAELLRRQTTWGVGLKRTDRDYIRLYRPSQDSVATRCVHRCHVNKNR